MIMKRDFGGDYLSLRGKYCCIVEPLLKGTVPFAEERSFDFLRFGVLEEDVGEGTRRLFLSGLAPPAAAANRFVWLLLLAPNG